MRAPIGLLPAEGTEAEKNQRAGTDKRGSKAKSTEETGATSIDGDEGGVGRSEREAEWRTYLRQQLGVKDDRKVGGIAEDIPDSLAQLQHGVDPTAVIVLEPIYNLVRANKQRVKPPKKGAIREDRIPGQARAIGRYPQENGKLLWPGRAQKGSNRQENTHKHM